MGDLQFEVHGLQELVASFARVDAKVSRGLTIELKQIGDDLKTRVQSYIIGQGLYDLEHAPDELTGSAGAGPMVDKVYVRVVGARRVIVLEKQRRISKGYRSGYSYPARYEFQAGGARSFMRPAVVAEKPLMEAKLRAWIARMLAESGW